MAKRSKKAWTKWQGLIRDATSTNVATSGAPIQPFLKQNEEREKNRYRYKQQREQNKCPNQFSDVEASQAPGHNARENHAYPLECWPGQSMQA